MILNVIFFLYYGAISWQVFETHAAKMSNINQIMLVISSVILVCISVIIWKRRHFVFRY